MDTNLIMVHSPPPPILAISASEEDNNTDVKMLQLTTCRILHV